MPSFYKNEDDENHQEYEQDDKGEKMYWPAAGSWGPLLAGLRSWKVFLAGQVALSYYGNSDDTGIAS